MDRLLSRSPVEAAACPGSTNAHTACTWGLAPAVHCARLIADLEEAVKPRVEPELCGTRHARHAPGFYCVEDGDADSQVPAKRMRRGLEE